VTNTDIEAVNEGSRNNLKATSNKFYGPDSLASLVIVATGYLLYSSVSLLFLSIAIISKAIVLTFHGYCNNWECAIV
jgi:hypothetical protein